MVMKGIEFFPIQTTCQLPSNEIKIGAYGPELIWHFGT